VCVGTNGINVCYRFYRTGTFAGTNYVMHNTYLQLPVMAQLSFGDAVGKRGAQLRGFVNVASYAVARLHSDERFNQLMEEAKQEYQRKKQK